MIHQLTPSNETDTTTPNLPKFGWIRVRRNGKQKGADVTSWIPNTSGPYVVPITRWIE